MGIPFGQEIHRAVLFGAQEFDAPVGAVGQSLQDASVVAQEIDLLPAAFEGPDHIQTLVTE